MHQPITILFKCFCYLNFENSSVVSKEYKTQILTYNELPCCCPGPRSGSFYWVYYGIIIFLFVATTDHIVTSLATAGCAAATIDQH